MSSKKHHKDEMKAHDRVNTSLLGAAEKRALRTIAGYLPDWVTPDRMTGLGFGAAILIAASYWLTNYKVTNSIIFPAAFCKKNISFDGDECTHRIDICNSVKIDLVPFNGFAWLCPGCEKSNNEIKMQTKVICKTCERTFLVKKRQIEKQKIKDT